MVLEDGLIFNERAKARSFFVGAPTAEWARISSMPCPASFVKRKVAQISSTFFARNFFQKKLKNRLTESGHGCIMCSQVKERKSST